MCERRKCQAKESQEFCGIKSFLILQKRSIFNPFVLIAPKSDFAARFCVKMGL